MTVSVLKLSLACPFKQDDGGEPVTMNVTDQLHRAIHAGLLPEVQRLVMEGAKVDHVLGMRGTALCAAIEARNIDITNYLISVGCDVNAQDYDGEPPLLLALRKDCPGQILGKKPAIHIAKVLIENKNCNINKVDPLTKKTALHFVSEQGMKDVAEWLMCAPYECNVNAVDKNGNSALHLAVFDGHYEVVKVLLSNPKCLVKLYNRAGLTPLHICANNGDIKSSDIIISRLRTSSKDTLMYELETGVQRESEMSVTINAVTMFEKETCLHLAARNSHVSIIRLLLQNGIKVDCLNNINNTALLLSLGSVHQWQTMENVIPKLLLSKGANPNIRAPVRCRYITLNSTVTPLIMAAKNNNVELVKLLIQHGVDVNKSDNYGQTPFYIALSENAQPVAQYLLWNCPNMNVNIITEDGSTCLHAVMKFISSENPEVQVDMVRNLIQVGAKLLPNKHGDTPIDAAFDHENHLALDALLEGSQTDAEHLVYREDSGDDNPNMLSVAVTNGSLDLIRVLLSHGANIDLKIKSQRNESLLYIALFNSEFKVAKYLVENGCNLQQDFIFKVYASKGTSQANIHTEDGSDSDGDSECDELDQSDCDSDDSENFDVFRGNQEFKQWLQEAASSTRSLELLSLINIRTYLRSIGTPLYKISSLPIPEKLKNKIRYR